LPRFLLLDPRHPPWHALAELFRQPRRVRFPQPDHALRLEPARRGVEVLPLRDALPVPFDEHRLEALAPRRERRLDVPVGRPPEGPARFLALDHEADRHALHAPRAQPRTYLAPEHGRQRETEEPVEDAPALLRANQLLVDLARVLHGFVDGGLRNLVEHDALDRHLRLQRLDQVPADRLALAVFVRGKHEHLRIAEHGLDFAHSFLAVFRDHIVRREIVLNIHRKARPRFRLDGLRHLVRRTRQVANMAVTGHDLVVTAEETADRFRLRGRFDNNQLQNVFLVLRPGAPPARQP